MAIARVGASGQPIPMGGIGDILEGGRGYLGPGRLIPPAIGGGSALGLQALWNKITGGEDEAEDDIELTDEEKEAVETAREKYGDEAALITEKQLKQIKKMFQPKVDEQEKELEMQRKKAKETVKELIRNSPVPAELKEEELLDQASQAIVDSAEQKVKDGAPIKEATLEAAREVMNTLIGTGSFTKHAQGGLVGINHLTRRL